MKVFVALRSAFTHTGTLYGVGTALLVVSSFLLFSHARLIAETQTNVVPLVAELPGLERTKAILQEQAELAELETVARVGSQTERVNTYVLPKKADLDRTLAFFEVLRSVLGKQGTLATISEITFSDTTQNDSSASRPFTVTFAVHESALQDIAALIRLSGFMTVGDALTKDEISVLTEIVEEENPSGIVALEQFLSTDLLSYCQNTRLAEERLLRSFTSTAFIQSLQNVTRTSLLRDASRVLGGEMGAELSRYDLWPLQMMTTDSVELQSGKAEGWYTATMHLRLQLRQE